jgi:hypothetical protein
VYLQLIEEMRTQPMIEFAKIGLFIKDAETCQIDDLKLLADDAAQNKRNCTNSA